MEKERETQRDEILQVEMNINITTFVGGEHTSVIG